MAFARITTEEQIGLGLAAVAHAALAWALMTQTSTPEPIIVKPEPMVVTLSDDVGLKSTAPDPVPEAAMAPPSASSAQDLPSAVQPDSFTLPEPFPTSRPAPAPTSRATRTPTPTPRASSRSTPTPTPRASSRSTPTPTPRSSSRSTPTPTPRSSSRSTPTPTPRSSSRNTGFDGAFGSGSVTSESSSNSGTQAAEAGPAVRSSLLSAIQRQIRPKWDAPTGPDAEQLYTLVTFRLNRDGSLAGDPACKPTQGVNDTNRTQAGIHCERAKRAVRLAAPFSGLPDEYYSAWSRISDFRFSGRL